MDGMDFKSISMGEVEQLERHFVEDEAPKDLNEDKAPWLDGITKGFVFQKLLG